MRNILRSSVQLVALASLATAACGGSGAGGVIELDGGDAAIADSATLIDAPEVGRDQVSIDAPTPSDRPAVDAPDAGPEAGPGRCRSDSDCSGDSAVCDTTTGRCGRCSEANQAACLASEHCDAMTGRCVAGCRSDEGCGTSGDGGVAGACDTARHTCVECVTDLHCGAGRLCVGNVCVPGCNPGQSCPAGQSCCGGACADTGNNTAHCGACGSVCRVANASPACMNGVCVVGACDAGRADCNGRVDDGCEVALGGDVANCGACGNACATPANAASATCVAGRCGFTCAAGFADCDGDATNGCEVDLRASASHCGLCGNACPSAPNAAAGSCVAGRCGFTCDANFGDCDGDTTNGCEQDLRASVAHCGRCANACPVRPNTSALCVAGACGSFCTQGWADCDGESSNGCEVDVRVSTAHCGMCGRACRPANAVAACVGGGCAIGSCAAGYGDCDGDPANGCESNLLTSTSSCGACGRACAVANGSAVCASGACQVAACNAGFADCDRGPGNGCEVNLGADPNNCGACGVRGTEVCDGVDNDCDGAVDEGCPVSLGGLTGSDYQSPTWGGGGGGPFDFSCPAGQVVTGVFGRAGSRIDALGIICGTPVLRENRGTRPFQYSVEVVAGGTVGPAGGGGGGAFRYDCPAHSMVMRVQGRSGSRLDQLRVECYRMELALSGAWRIQRSSAIGGSSFFGGGGGGAFEYLCPTSSSGVPSAVRRLYGGSGSEIDRAGFFCGLPALTLR